MTKSLSQINSQIAALQQQAQNLLTTVVARVKKEIAQHGLTVEQLFGEGKKEASPAPEKKTRMPKTPKAAKSKASVVQFADGKGNTWAGRGKRPNWISKAVAVGKDIESFRVKVGATTVPAAAIPALAAAPTPKAKKSTSQKPVTRRSAEYDHQYGLTLQGKPKAKVVMPSAKPVAKAPAKSAKKAPAKPIAKAVAKRAEKVASKVATKSPVKVAAKSASKPAAKPAPSKSKTKAAAPVKVATKAPAPSTARKAVKPSAKKPVPSKKVSAPAPKPNVAPSPADASAKAVAPSA